jgi:hypothetical protein
MHRKIGDDEIQRAFIRDLALRHLPAIYRALHMMAEQQGITLDETPIDRSVRAGILVMTDAGDGAYGAGDGSEFPAPVDDVCSGGAIGRWMQNPAEETGRSGRNVYDAALECRGCQAELGAAQGDLADEKMKTQALSRERDDALQVAKGGSAMQPIMRAAKWFAIGAAAGALAAKIAH